MRIEVSVPGIRKERGKLPPPTTLGALRLALPLAGRPLIWGELDGSALCEPVTGTQVGAPVATAHPVSAKTKKSTTIGSRQRRCRPDPPRCDDLTSDGRGLHPHRGACHCDSVCVAGLGLRYSTIATSAQWRRYAANRVPISSSFTSAASAFDSDVAGKAVPLRPYSRLLSGRLPQLGPYVTFERGARSISGHETGGSGHRTAVYLRSSAAVTSFIGPGAGAVPGAGWGNAVDAAVWKVMLPFF